MLRDHEGSTLSLPSVRIALKFLTLACGVICKLPLPLSLYVCYSSIPNLIRSNIFADADEVLSPEEEAALQRFIAAYEIEWNEELEETAPNVNSTRDQIARDLWAQWILTGQSGEDVEEFMFG